MPAIAGTTPALRTLEYLALLTTLIGTASNSRSPDNKLALRGCPRIRVQSSAGTSAKLNGSNIPISIAVRITEEHFH